MEWSSDMANVDPLQEAHSRLVQRLAEYAMAGVLPPAVVNVLYDLTEDLLQAATLQIQIHTAIRHHVEGLAAVAQATDALTRCHASVSRN
jgi:hypothetical protein